MDRSLTALRIIPPTEFNKRTRFANLNRPLPWLTNLVDAIYLGEVLEHFTRSEGEQLLAECFRILKPSGILRIRVPDNARFWRNYLTDFDACYSLPRSKWTDKHSIWIERFFRDIAVRRKLLASFGHYHKWMYDEISLILLLEKLGFTDVERHHLHDSRIEGIAAVEVREDLIVEGIKPS